MIRQAQERHAAALARIYNQAMRPGVFATCDTTDVSEANRIEWLSHHHNPYPAFVYEDRFGEVVGWSSLSPFSVRKSYITMAEVSVYVEQSHRSGRIGGELLLHLVYEARQLGFRSLISLAFEKNVTSNAGCAAFGFRPNAVLYEVARMNGAWENVLWLQKDLLLGDPERFSKLMRSVIARQQVDSHEESV